MPILKWINYLCSVDGSRQYFFGINFKSKQLNGPPAFRMGFFYFPLHQVKKIYEQR